MSEQRLSLHEQITRKIVSDIEQGCIPWVQPWRDDGPAWPGGLPRNAVTGRAYSGVNVLLLWAAAAERRFLSGRWLTFRQALYLGGCVRRGERGVQIVFADRIQTSPLTDEDHEQAPLPGPRVLRRFTVFNLDQCEGLPPSVVAQTSLTASAEVFIPRADALVEATGADIRIGGAHAFYAPGPDYIRIPPPEMFHEPVNWHRTRLHELAHWTGHASRLARDFTGRWASEAYAREELVAELCAAFLCAELGVAPTVRHGDYIGAWLHVLKGDSRAVFQAASLASRAANYLLSFGRVSQTTPCGVGLGDQESEREGDSWGEPGSSHQRAA
jgi:antirestriction protein ArdC